MTSRMHDPSRFDARAYLPRKLYEEITEIRVRQPGFADAEADRRTRRPALAPDGRLVILVADHPGRNSLRIQDEPLPVVREQGTYKIQRPVAALAGAVGAASALGTSSLYTWLKLPTCPGFAQVAADGR